jgi:hypothetical protein
MPPKLEELLQLKIHLLHEELGEMTRPQLQALAKKCGLKVLMKYYTIFMEGFQHLKIAFNSKLPESQISAIFPSLQANQRTLELTGCLAEYIIKEKRARGHATGTPYSTHETPHNPIYNPRYAPTDSKKALHTRGSDAVPSTGEAVGGKEWHLTKSKELAELEAALKTMPPPQKTQRSGRVAGPTPSLAGAEAPVTGKKRKYDSAVTPAEHPPAKRQPSTTPYANTLELRRAILRRPGQSKPTVPSRLGRTSSTPAAVPATENKERMSTQGRPSCTTRSNIKKVKFSPAPQKVASQMTIETTRANNSLRGQNTPFCSRNVVHTATPDGSVAQKPTMRAISSAKSRTGAATRTGGTASKRSRGSGTISGKSSSSSSSLRVAAAIRATQAHEAYIARMRKAQK